MVNKKHINYSETILWLEKLKYQIKNSNLPITNISGIPRGGLIPAVLLSHMLDLPYNTKINANTLLIDDIADTGETLFNTSAVYTASLVYKPHTSKIKPTFYAYEHTNDDWIVFFWEKKEAKPIQGYLEYPH